MTIKSKKIFIAFKQPGDDQSVFYRLWQLVNLETPLMRQDPVVEPELARVHDEIARFQPQMRRQQVHIDEIKRLCHVPTR